MAILVSIRTANLPYKKKLVVSTGSFISSDGIGIHVTATNVGNRKIKIKKMGILIGEMVYVDKNALLEGCLELCQGDEISHYFRIDELQQLIKKNNIGMVQKMIAFVEDTEGKKYKKRISRVRQIMKI